MSGTELGMKRTELLRDRFRQVESGLYFTYRRAWPLRVVSRGAGLGQVLDVDHELGVVHVRVFRTVDEDDSELEGRDLVAIGHLPVGVRGLVRSSPTALDVQTVPADACEHIDLWRTRRAAGDVDAFGVPLWNAVRLVAETVASKHSGRLDELFIASAWVRRDERGALRVVEVVAFDRELGSK